VVPTVVIVVSAISFFVRNFLANVLINALSFANGTNGEGAATLNARTTNFVDRRLD